MPIGGLIGADRDADGLTDRRELDLGTDPDNPDTDFDGLADGAEIDAGTSPLDPDSDGDGIVDGADDTINPPFRPNGSVSTGNDVEPNDTFAQAVVLDTIGAADLVYEGTIDRARDVDVFDLGPLAPGDTIIADRDPVTGGLDALLAIFDDAQACFVALPGSFDTGGPGVARLVDETIRHHADHYFFAISHAQDVSLGAYRIVVSIVRGGDPATPTPQPFFLDFDGATLAEPIFGTILVAPFDAGAIMPMYAGETATLKRGITASVERNFIGFDVTVLTSDDGDFSADPGVSTLSIGSFSDTVFGVSEGVDAYNMNRCDDGIVFAESFTPGVFGFAPSINELADAIGNVIAHEAGHLLGLRHVDDPVALMDEQSPAVTLLSDQRFKTAVLSESVFPIGVQDAPTLLLETVGAP
ncbi:MAG: hypothetical protein ACE5E6_11015 [Phycisphaerae bacterium]